MKLRLQNLWGKFRYRQIAMQPYMNFTILAALLFLISSTLIDKGIASVLLLLVLLQLIVKAISSYAGNTVQLNDFLIVRRHPFKFNIYYIYQVVNDKKLIWYNCSLLRDLYYSEMLRVLDDLKPGTYRTVTQSLFVQEILKQRNILVTTKIKAYKRKTVQLQNQVYMNRCRNCEKTDCSYKSSKALKQFYYLEFKVI